MPRHAAVDLLCEHRHDPLGIDISRPRLSWRMQDGRAGAHQTAWQLVAASQPELLEQPDLWDSGLVEGDRSLDIIYGGKRLRSRRDVYWRVRIADAKGTLSDWSETAHFSMGLLSQADWRGSWIARLLNPDREDGLQPCPHLRRNFVLRDGIVSARLYASAKGLFRCELNGRQVGADFFNPGWTEYGIRIPYDAFDVTELLHSGENAWGTILADGWYAGYLGWNDRRHVWGEQLAFRAQLEVRYADGSSQIIATDENWRTALGPYLQADHYHGETFDCRRSLPDWTQAHYDDHWWEQAVEVPAGPAKLVARRTDPVRAQEEMPTQDQSEPQFGVHIFDLGQNMVGTVRIKVRAHAGASIRIRYGEMLQADGTLYTANLRSARATDTYICAGSGEEVYVPAFTFHGFRYVELTGVTELPRPEDVTGIVLHSAMRRTGHFHCSHPLVNQLQSNIVWGQKGNFLEAPTDCPQRDERLGWTGDAQVFARTACFNFDVASFFSKWAIDLEDGQLTDGEGKGFYPWVLPNPLGPDSWGSTSWSAAGIICPWTIYQCYGDVRILADHYNSMTRFIGWMKKNSPGLINSKECFGDWLAVDHATGNPAQTPTPMDLIATAYFAHCCALVARIAGVLGKAKDETKFDALAKNVRKAFRKEFLTEGGRLAGDTQTAYLLALGFDLLGKKQRPAAFARLVQLLEARGVQLTTGFLGTPLLAPVLTRFGRSDLAYRLLLRTDYPGWLYTVEQGATTMWERWNSWTKEGGFGEVSMNSFNHYAYGAIGEWLYATVTGIDLHPTTPGYKHIVFRPQPGPGIDSAEASLDTRYGTVSSSWKLSGKGAKRSFKLAVTVPPNTSAALLLPDGSNEKLRPGSHRFKIPYPADKQ